MRATIPKGLPCARAVRSAARLLTLAYLAQACLPGGVSAQSTMEMTAARNRMVDHELAGAGLTNQRVIDSLRSTPRHEFVVFKDRPLAYFDMALPIGEGQTISPPFIVGFMTEQLDPQPTDVVLEIGTGSGYQAAILSPLVKKVYTIEIVPTLGRHAAQVLKKLDYKNVYCKIGDGYQGWTEHAPFDKIIVTCSPENVPQALVDQLREGGRLIVPLGERYQQMLYLFRKEQGKLVSEALRPTLFVPMTGKAEEGRKVLPDPLKPGIVNGSFEDVVKEGNLEVPKGWHYARQVALVEDKLSPDGQRHAVFTNTEPGRGSQALQGFAIDGRKVDSLDLSFRVRGKNIGPGQNTRQLPVVGITFYDEKQNPVGERAVGPWRGSFPWQTEHEVLSVPAKAHHAIIRVGLLGGVGELAIDAIDLHAAKKN